MPNAGTNGLPELIMSETALKDVGRSALFENPTAFLMSINFVNFLAFASWSVLINNFVVENAGFTFKDNGIMQSVREIPGFLAFTAIFFILFLREQTFAYLSMLALCVGVLITGYFPSLTGILITTFIMSVGFHYLETMQQSLALQLLPKATAAAEMGKVAGAGAASQFVAYGGVAILAYIGFTNFQTLFLIVGVACVILAIAVVTLFKKFDGPVPQRKQIVLRQRYWLYYAITFMSGARRQIFAAFAAFLLVKTFGYSIAQVALLMLVMSAINTVLAPRLGQFISKHGERPSIMVENVSLILIFAGYALASNGSLGSYGAFAAAFLFVVDGVFTTFYIAPKTYFQKIGDAEDMAPTAAVAFTINHIMAVIIPVVFGVLAVARPDPSIIFWLGCGIATMSLSLAFLVPRHPSPGMETIFKVRAAQQAAK
jgi:predicted MFS family arabinose efflux permease